MHAGMDFRAGTGTPVRAPGAGKVLRAEVAGGYGNLIELDHGNGLTTRYGHLTSFDVKPGQIVAAGTIIGRVGSTGRSTGPHLHYETRLDDDALNPLKFIQIGARLSHGPNGAPPLR
jgi:murein DD-endopeptidase MepM/ murein hydrolase activator NlpD